MKIFALGDSHSGFNFNFIPEVESKGVGPVTMYRVGRDKLDFKNISDKECIVIFCFGEIDVRVHLPQHCNDENEDQVIEKLARDYLNVIETQRTDKVIPVIMGITPPCKSTSLTPSKGTDEQRARYGRKLNNYLKLICAEKNLDFLDIYDYYIDENGNLLFDLSDKANHIWNTKYIEKVFYEFLESKNIDKRDCVIVPKVL